MQNSFKSNLKIYWSLFALFIFLVISISYFFIKNAKDFSFEFYFLMMIPLWIAVLSVFNYETQRIKKYVRKYLLEYYPEKLKEFDEKPVDLLNSDSEDILDLFKDSYFVTDPLMNQLSKESDRVTLFMYTYFLTTPALLLTTYFVILK